MKLRTIAFIGAASLGGLGLIGVGAHAAFTTNTYSTQSITAGTASVVEWAAGASNGCTSLTIAVGNPGTCTSVTLPTQTVGSTFESTAYVVHVVNIGNIPVSGISAAVTDNGSNALESEMGICLDQPLGALASNLLTDVESHGPYPLNPSTLTTGSGANATSTGTYSVDFYAGVTDTLCGGGYVPALLSDAEGETSTVTVTVTYNG